MKTSTWLSTAILSCCIVGTALAANVTEREAFQKRVAKVAPLAGARPKALCYCVNQTSSIFQGRVGFIRHSIVSSQVYVNCQGDLFDADGNDVGGFACSEFRPLVK